MSVDDTLIGQDADDDFSSDGNGGWSDIEVVDADSLIIDTSYNTQNRSLSEECWQCTNCNTINNVKLTITRYNYKCCGCKEELYIPTQTQTTYKSKWDTPNDYLMKINKIWICDSCKQINSNIQSFTCSICHSTRFNMKLCQYCNKYIHSLSYIPHQIHCMKNQINATSWVCVKCNVKQTNNSIKCRVCNCNRAQINIQSLHQTKNGVVIDGFCRYYFSKDIPDDIKGLLINYFSSPQTFSAKGDMKNITRYFHEGTKVKLFGDKLFKYPNKNTWKFKLKLDSRYIFKLDGDNEAAKIYDIAIGVAYKSSKYSTIKGHGSHSLPILKDGDIIIIELDCKKQMLSFGINRNWFGTVFDDLPIDTKYRLYIEVKQQGVIIEAIN